MVLIIYVINKIIFYVGLPWVFPLLISSRQICLTLLKLKRIYLAHMTDGYMKLQTLHFW